MSEIFFRRIASGLESKTYKIKNKICEQTDSNKRSAIEIYFRRVATYLKSFTQLLFWQNKINITIWKVFVKSSKCIKYVQWINGWCMHFAFDNPTIFPFKYNNRKIKNPNNFWSIKNFSTQEKFWYLLISLVNAIPTTQQCLLFS